MFHVSSHVTQHRAYVSCKKKLVDVVVVVAVVVVVVVLVVLVFVLSFRQDVYVHKRLGLIVHCRYRVTWESRLPATRVPLLPSPRALTGVSARGLQKNRLAQKFER